MTNDIWNLFPYPTLTAEGLTDGSLLTAHPDCVSCPKHPCLEDAPALAGEAKHCKFGLTYARIDDERLVAGVVCNDLMNPTQKGKKRANHEPKRRVSAGSIRTAVGHARQLGAGVVMDYSLAKDEFLSRLEKDPALYASIAEQLRQDFSDNLSQSHDFLQLVKLVRGHAEALLHEKYPALSPADAADLLPTEGAIYYSTELMMAKMDSMVFLNEINQALGGEVRFQIHPLVVKYLKIYNWQADQKDLKIVTDGNAYAFSFYNARAIGAVVQGLLDNLVKYAPAGSRASVTFAEREGDVLLTFTSLGPRIAPGERHRIFLPKFRAVAAREVELSGLGVGLAVAKEISDALDLALSVDQEHAESSRFPGRYATHFRLRLGTLS